MTITDITKWVPDHHRTWEGDLQLLAERLREEPVEYFKEAAAWIEALGMVTDDRT